GFVQRRDQAAFAELVRRYGPLVRAACRRALGDGPDADDAFQAVFLILARKAHTVRGAGLLGPWLHTVAVRAAARARVQARRRLARAGAVVAGAAVTAALVPTAEAVPPELIAVTTRAAATGATSAPVAALTDGVLKAMLYAKLKIALIAVLTIGISAGTVVAV